jgi:DNA-binding transcriptional LysR family regulator
MLGGEAMIATVNSSWSWSTVERAFDSAGAQCNVVAECDFIAIAINMVAAGLGVCIADPLSVRELPGLIVRPFRPTLPYDVGLLRPVHGRLTRLAEAFAADFHTHVAPYLVEV